jgi:hypothetical protein
MDHKKPKYSFNIFVIMNYILLKLIATLSSFQYEHQNIRHLQVT